MDTLANARRELKYDLAAEVLLAARRLGGEMMIMSARDSTRFSLNEVGAVIGQAADGTPLEEIVEREVRAEFDVEPAEALKDAEGLVREPAAHGILAVCEPPIA